MRRELVTIGDLGAFSVWGGDTSRMMLRHPVMSGIGGRYGGRMGVGGIGSRFGGRMQIGAIAQPVFAGAPSARLQSAAAALYHRLLSGGCPQFAIPEAKTFQDAYNAERSGSTLGSDGLYGDDSSAGLQYVITASAGQGGDADGLFDAPPGCVAHRVAPPAPAPAPQPLPPPPPPPHPLVLPSKPTTGGGGGALLAVLALGAIGYMGYASYMKRKRQSNPMRRMCSRGRR